MNKIRNSSMFLLWAGAAISISEIYTGGLIAPIGFVKGLIAIVAGHIIGTCFLALGGYISFKQGKNAMESVKGSLGGYGAKIVAFLNVLQLIGWSAIMIIQGGRALNFVFPGLSPNIAVFIMALVVLIWVYYFNNYSKIINDISVIMLIILSAALFWKIDMGSIVGLDSSMNFATVIAYVFPIEEYQSFLLIIGSVFVPIYTIVFLEYFMSRVDVQVKINIPGMTLALAGTVFYYYLNTAQLGIPTVFVICTVTVLYVLITKIMKEGKFA